MAHQHLPRVVTISGAEALGYTRARVRTELRRQRWRWLASGVLLTRPEPPTRDDWIMAGIALGGPAAALSGWDVLTRVSIGGPKPPDPRVLILSPSVHNRTLGGVLLRRTSRPAAISRYRIRDEALPDVPMVGVARAVADTALQMRHRAPVRAMVTASVQRGLATTDELRQELIAGPRNGSKWLRLALSDLDGGARSIAEAEAIELLRAHPGVPSFEVNVAITDEIGRVVAVADLYWRDLRAILEVDSREFHFSEDDWKRTGRRHNQLIDLGYAVKHYPPSEIRARGAGWADDVAQWLARRRRELRLPA